MSQSKQKQPATVTEQIHRDLTRRYQKKAEQQVKQAKQEQSAQQNTQQQDVQKLQKQNSSHIYSVGNLVVVMLPEKIVDFDANGNILYPNLDYGQHYSKTVEFIKELYSRDYKLVTVNFNPLKNGFYLWFQRN